MAPPKPFKTGVLPSGQRVEFHRTAAGRTLRLCTPGPAPHAGRLEVFEQAEDDSKVVSCVCTVDSDLDVLNFLLERWIGGN